MLFLNSKSIHIFYALTSCSCKSWVWLLCQPQWFPGSWSLCFPSSSSSYTFVATSCRHLEMWSASSQPVSIVQYTDEYQVLCISDVQGWYVCSSSYSSKSCLLPLVLVSSGLVDHPSISGRGQVPESLWWLSRLALTSETLHFIVSQRESDHYGVIYLSSLL